MASQKLGDGNDKDNESGGEWTRIKNKGRKGKGPKRKEDRKKNRNAGEILRCSGSNNEDSVIYRSAEKLRVTVAGIG